MADVASPKEVIGVAENVLEHIAKIRHRAGMYGKGSPRPQGSGKITPNDVHNMLAVIMAELISLKTHLGLDKTPEALEALD